MSLELLVKKTFGLLGYQIQQVPVAAWEKDAAFQEILREISGVTLLDPVRCYMLYQLARRARTLEGDAAEVGVYRGGTARLLGRTLSGSGKTLHLFDTFAGMPETDARHDKHQAGDFADNSLEAVKRTLAGLEALSFHQGLFPETAQPVEEKRFCLVHIDVDIHKSIAEACAFFYPRLVPGGILLFDDYGSPSCPGVKTAVDAYFAEKTEPTLYLPTGQCLVFRTR